MTKVIKYRDDMLGWQRKPGPLRVWRLVDGRKKSADGKTMRFSIQEIPENRLDDALDLMCSIFTRDEPLCHYLKVIDDPIAVEDFRKLWSLVLGKGLAVGAFLVDENNPRPVLAGVNMSLVACEITNKTLQTGIEFRSGACKKVLRFMHELETTINTREVYNVDKSITAFGLCVDPEYRGQDLGFQLLRVRDDMSVAYDIHATTTVFTAAAAQKSAAKAGFELLVERKYADFKNEDGTEMFPGITHKTAKLMGKKF